MNSFHTTNPQFKLLVIIIRSLEWLELEDGVLGIILPRYDCIYMCGLFGAEARLASVLLYSKVLGYRKMLIVSMFQYIFNI